MTPEFLTRAKYSSSAVVEFANRWKFHARYRWSGTPFDQKYRFLEGRSLGHGTIVDVGANYGQSALSLRHFAPHQPILCIEANPTLAPAMELTRRRVPDCSYVIAAVSDTVGVQELNIPTFGAVANTGGASLDRDFVDRRGGILEDRYQAPLEMRTQTVPTITIDSLGLDIALLKIDVEGLEDRVLRGATHTIERCRPIVVMEVLNSDGEAMRLLSSMGYTLFADLGSGLEPVEPAEAMERGLVDTIALPSRRSAS